VPQNWNYEVAGPLYKAYMHPPHDVGGQFDAPILYCMYLDKPMRDHVLLQAIARVNRPYEDDDGQVKPYGFVLDFVGIFEKLEKALAFDSDVVASVIQNIDVLKQLFAAMLKEQAPEYLPFTKGWDDKAKERAIAHFEDKERRGNFFKFFRQGFPCLRQKLRFDFIEVFRTSMRCSPRMRSCARTWMITLRSLNFTR
jgi:hypothetical protein